MLKSGFIWRFDRWFVVCVVWMVSAAVLMRRLLGPCLDGLSHFLICSLSLELCVFYQSLSFFWILHSKCFKVLTLSNTYCIWIEWPKFQCKVNGFNFARFLLLMKLEIGTQQTLSCQVFDRSIIFSLFYSLSWLGEGNEISLIGYFIDYLFHWMDSKVDLLDSLVNLHAFKGGTVIVVWVSDWHWHH